MHKSTGKMKSIINFNQEHHHILTCDGFPSIKKRKERKTYTELKFVLYFSLDHFSPLRMSDIYGFQNMLHPFETE